MKKLIICLMVIVLLSGCGVVEKEAVENPYGRCSTWEEIFNVIFTDEFEMVHSIPARPLLNFRNISDISVFMENVSEAVSVIGNPDTSGVNMEAIEYIPSATTISVGAGVTIKIIDDGSTQIDVQGSFEGADEITSAYYEKFG